MTPQGPSRGTPEASDAFRGELDLARTPILRGTTVVEASAGTGKTYCLTGVVLRLLLEGQVPGIGRVLVVTYTVAACDELIHRVRGAMASALHVLEGTEQPKDDFFRHLARAYGGERRPQSLDILRRARLELDDLMVVTIHGFAKRVLDQHAFESGVPFRQDFLEEATETRLQAARDFWRQTFYPADPLLATVAAHRRWTPETFLGDLEVFSRHPGTELLPAVELDEAKRQLRRAAQAISKALEIPGALADMGRTLASVQLKANSRLQRASIAPLLVDLEAFAQHREVAGLGAAESLALDFLKEQVYKKEQSRLDPLPIARACQQLRDAVQSFEHALRGAFSRQVQALFERHKERAGQMTFDDLLQRLHQALRGPRSHALRRAVREQFQVALIDEFQDTDHIQYDIFRQLFRGAPLFLIGDPKQAIYRFRGADVFTYMKARRDADRVHSLGKNWRSTPALVDAVGAVFSASPRPFVFPEIPFHAVEAAHGASPQDEALDSQAPLQWLWLPQEKNQDAADRTLRRALCEEIRRLLGTQAPWTEPDGTRRPVVPGDIAVLVRTNRQAQELRDALQQAHIPAVLSRAGDIFHSGEMQELRRILEAVAEPTRGAKVRTAAATVLWGDSAKDLVALEQDDAAWQQRVDELLELRRLWMRAGFMPMLQQLIRQRGMKAHLLSLEGGERRLTNVLHAAELLHQASHAHHLSPLGLLRWLDVETRRDRPQTDGSELRLDRDAEAVQIATVHKSKGLEYNIVFCPYLWKAQAMPKKPVLAHLSERRRVFDHGSDDLPRHRAMAEAEWLAEELRLAYVAMTRARHRCYVVWGKVGRAKTAADSALAYLLHQPVCGPSLALDDSAAEHTARVRRGMEQRFDGWLGALGNWVKRHEKSMVLRLVEPQAFKTVPTPTASTAEALACRNLPPDADRRMRPWSMVSFSSLSRPQAEGRAEGPEHDDPTSTEVSGAPEATPQDPPAQNHSVRDHPVRDTSVRSIFSFAQGRQAGHCFHYLLEHCDLSQLDSASNAELIERSLRRYGLDQPAAHGADLDPADVLKRLLARLASSPVPGEGFHLADVPPTEWKTEERFYAPIERLSGQKLADLFGAHGEGRIAENYAPRLAGLQGSSLAGFLTGIIDLVFEHDGRWWVLDWKSNHLGNHLQNYDDDGMWQAMQHHHYVLQYHLYSLALHRHLRQRLPDYDYESHFGGVLYVFLRGLQEPPETGSTTSTGWYRDRPPVSLIDALDRQALTGGMP